MNRKTIIVITSVGITECWGNLKKACDAHSWAYNTVSKLKLPVDYKGFKIERVLFN